MSNLLFVCFNDVSFKNLNDFKQNQMLRYKPQTVNLRIQAINTFPKQLSLEIYKWGVSVGSTTGHLCQNNRGMPITTRGFSLHLKKIAQKYDVDVAVVHPHSFRHMYAKKFLESYSDVSLLADLLGHENIETTRIYLRRSNTEQRHLIDNIVTW